jgi:hypothetical protein
MTKQPEALRIADALEKLDMVFSNEISAELRRLHEVNVELLEALEAASEHLDYVGYGDSWERECAHHARLPERIAAAIAKTYPVAAPPENTKAPITGKEKRKQLRRIKKAAISKATGETE